jgi:hypothetical protein
MALSPLCCFLCFLKMGFMSGCNPVKQNEKAINELISENSTNGGALPIRYAIPFPIIHFFTKDPFYHLTVVIDLPIVAETFIIYGNSSQLISRAVVGSAIWLFISYQLY